MTRRDATARKYADARLLNPGLPPGVPCTLEGIAEHMRCHALALEFERGPGDVTHVWLGQLADRIADDTPLKEARRGPVPRQRTK